MCQGQRSTLADVANDSVRAMLCTGTPVRHPHCRSVHQQADTPVPRLKNSSVWSRDDQSQRISQRVCGHRPGAAALLCGDVTTKFSVLSRNVARFADYLIDGGLRLGDRIAVMLPNRPGSPP